MGFGMCWCIVSRQDARNNLKEFLPHLGGLLLLDLSTPRRPPQPVTSDGLMCDIILAMSILS